MRWTLDGGQIRNDNGWVVASVPYTLGDETDHANGVLIANAPELLDYAIRMLKILKRNPPVSEKDKVNLDFFEEVIQRCLSAYEKA